ncbi:MAG TPA: DUF5666 domain-containing protein [Xanthomonadaceae bacterium]|nr:DUF5666 domain-containing protein [Xanthomonadaceae bacterium]
MKLLATRLRLFGIALLPLLLLTGCATGDLGGILGGIPTGGGQPYPTGASSGQLIGTVSGVDPSMRRLQINADTSGYGGGARTDVYYDERTQVIYQGQSHSASSLEVGDRVRLDLADSGGRMWARNIEVLEDVSPGNGYGGASTGFAGHVRSLDTRKRSIEVVDANQSTRRVGYDANTMFYGLTGQRLLPADLVQGDLVEVELRSGGSVAMAQRITLRRGDSGSGYPPAAGGQQLQGTVGLVDARARTIELYRTAPYAYSSGSSGQQRVILYFDERTAVEYQGRTSYDPQNLERGDVIRVQARAAGSNWLAERIWVERSGSGGY